MDGIEFSPCANPTRGILAAAATLAVTLVALRALNQLKTPMGWAAAGTLPAAVGILASSLKRPAVLDDPPEDPPPPVTLPTMQDNVLPDAWTHEQCEQLKTLDRQDSGDLLREAALSGTIEMVRWCLEQAFTNDPADRARYDLAFQGELPQFDGRPIPNDKPIRVLYNRSHEARLEPVFELLAQVRKADADPEGYVILATLPAEDQALLNSIIPKMRAANTPIIDAVAANYNISKPIATRLCRAFGFKEDFSAELDEARRRVAYPPADNWTERQRALVILHYSQTAQKLGDLPLKATANNREREKLECLFDVAEAKAWLIRPEERTELEATANAAFVLPKMNDNEFPDRWKPETWAEVKKLIDDGDNSGSFLQEAAFSCSREAVRYILEVAVTQDRFALIDNAFQLPLPEIGGKPMERYKDFAEANDAPADARKIYNFMRMIEAEREGRGLDPAEWNTVKIDEEDKAAWQKIRAQLFDLKREAEETRKRKARRYDLTPEQFKSCLFEFKRTVNTFKPEEFKDEELVFPNEGSYDGICKRTQYLYLLRVGDATSLQDLHLDQLVEWGQDDLLLKALRTVLKKGFPLDGLQALEDKAYKKWDDLHKDYVLDFSGPNAYGYNRCRYMLQAARLYAQDPDTQIDARGWGTDHKKWAREGTQPLSRHELDKLKYAVRRN